MMDFNILRLKVYMGKYPSYNNFFSSFFYIIFDSHCAPEPEKGQHFLIDFLTDFNNCHQCKSQDCSCCYLKWNINKILVPEKTFVHVTLHSLALWTFLTLCLSLLSHMGVIRACDNGVKMLSFFHLSPWKPQSRLSHEVYISSITEVNRHEAGSKSFKKNQNQKLFYFFYFFAIHDLIRKSSCVVFLDQIKCLKCCLLDNFLEISHNTIYHFHWKHIKLFSEFVYLMGRSFNWRVFHYITLTTEGLTLHH